MNGSLSGCSATAPSLSCSECGPGPSPASVSPSLLAAPVLEPPMIRRNDAISSSLNVVERERNWLSNCSSSKACVSASSGSMSPTIRGAASGRMQLDELAAAPPVRCDFSTSGTLREVLIDLGPQRHQTAALQQVRRFVARHRRPRIAAAPERFDAEHAELVEQGGARRCVHRHARVIVGEPVGAEQALFSQQGRRRRVLRSAANSFCRNVRAVSANRPDTDDGLTDAGTVQFGGETVAPHLRRQHGVDTSGADLIGPRGHADHAQRPDDPPTSSPICRSRARSAALSGREERRRRPPGAPCRAEPAGAVFVRRPAGHDEGARVNDDGGADESGAGHSTSMSTTSSASSVSKSKVRPESSPPPRTIGTLPRRAPTWLAIARGVGSVPGTR